MTKCNIENCHNSIEMTYQETWVNNEGRMLILKTEVCKPCGTSIDVATEFNCKVWTNVDGKVIGDVQDQS